MARRCWFDARFGTGKPQPLDAILAMGRGGRRVREIGLAADITEAARTDRFPLVAELETRSDADRRRVWIVSRRDFHTLSKTE